MDAKQKAIETFGVKLAEATTLIATLRGLLTEQAAQIEDKDKAIYALKLDNERIIAAAKIGASALRACSDAMENPSSYAATSLAKINSALAASGEAS